MEAQHHPPLVGIEPNPEPHRPKYAHGGRNYVPNNERMSKCRPPRRDDQKNGMICSGIEPGVSNFEIAEKYEVNVSTFRRQRAKHSIDPTMPRKPGSGRPRALQSAHLKRIRAL